jgi:hypothetical protein
LFGLDEQFSKFIDGIFVLDTIFANQVRNAWCYLKMIFPP